jgi:hypothetical protein
MMRHRRLTHEFVKHIPDDVRPGILYVSMEYGMVAHSCCCGCGEEVTTPLTPTDWKLTYDGQAISLNPSVGNWNLPCRSHYVITSGEVIAAGDWSEEQVVAERKRDRAAKARHYGTGTASNFDQVDKLPDAESEPPSKPKVKWLSRLRSWIR